MAAEKTYHYTLQDIERYLSGRMTTQEMHDIEKAALTDPFLYDAIDGYSKADPLVTDKHLNEIAALVHQTDKPEAIVSTLPLQKNKRWKWLVAAGIMGILGYSAWYFTGNYKQKNNTEIAQENTHVPSPKLDTTLTGSKVSTEPVTATDRDISAANTPKDVQKREPGTSTISPVENIPEPHSKSEKETVPAVAENFVADEVVAMAPNPVRNDTLNYQMRKVIAVNNNLKQHSIERNAAHGSNAPAQNGYNYILSKNYTGLVTDDQGNPLPGATVIANNQSSITDIHGRFNLKVPTAANQIDVSVAAIGYKKENTTLYQNRTAGIALEPDQMGLDEVVVVGFGTKKKRTATLEAYSQMKVDTLESSEYPYPEGGWAHFYDDLAAELGVNKRKANKLLHIKFQIEDGIPSNFTVVKTPDTAISDKAITAIKKGPRWENFRKKRKAEVKINVE